VIRSFRHKGLLELWRSGKSRRVTPEQATRVLEILFALDAAATPHAMNLPGYDFHGLRTKPQRWTVHVNGPWCVTFGWEGKDAAQVDLEQYH
jgi:proteic killer suppression protein